MTRAPVGAGHHNTRWPNGVVAHTKAMAAMGVRSRAISAALGLHPVTVQRWVNGASRTQSVRRFAKRVKATETPRLSRGPRKCARVNTPLRMGGLPWGLHDHYFPYAKCPPDVKHSERELAFLHASPYEVNLLNQANNGLAGLQFNLIPK